MDVGGFFRSELAGLNEAAGNPQTAARLYDVNAQKQQNLLQQQLAPLRLAISADQQRLSTMKDGTPEHTQTLNNMAVNIGKVRNVFGDKTPAEHPGRMAETVNGIRQFLHLGGKTPQQLKDAQTAKVNAFTNQDKTEAQEYAEGALPFALTPEGQKAAYQRQTELGVANARGTMKEYVSPDGKERNWFRPGDEPAGWQASQGVHTTKRQKATFVNPATKQPEEGSFDPSTGKYYNAAGDEVPGAQPYIKPAALTTFSEWLKENPNGTVEQYEAMLAKFHPASQMLGSWTIAEDEKGNPVLFNSKTREQRTAPAGMHKSGYFAKQIAPLEAAKLNIDDYMQAGNFSGPGDLALQHEFFTATQPATGFRMTKAQQDYLLNARNWKESALAHYARAAKGELFTDEQRKEIAKAAADAIAEKEKSLSGEGKTTPSGPVHQKNRQAQKQGADPLGVL